MIPLALPVLLKSKGLMITAILLGLIAAWGGLGWYGKARVERAFAEHRLEQARLVARQLENNLAEQQARQAAERVASAQFARGKKQTETEYAPIKTDLDFITAAYRRMLDAAESNSGTVPAGTDLATGPGGTACEEQLQEVRRRAARVTEAASGVVGDLEIAEQEIQKLIAIQGL